MVEDGAKKNALLRERFAQWGETALRFYEEVVRTHRFGMEQARKVLELLAVYRPKDVVAALSRACRFRAWSSGAVERILAAEASPRPVQETLVTEAGEQVERLLKEPPVESRAGAEYQKLLFESPEEDPNAESV